MDDNEIPPNPMPDGELKDFARAMYDFSASLNGMSLRVATWTQQMLRVGATPQMRAELAVEIREHVVAAGERAAQAIDPPAANGSHA
jgi:hypothetical protein